MPPLAATARLLDAFRRDIKDCRRESRPAEESKYTAQFASSAVNARHTDQSPVPRSFSKERRVRRRLEFQQVFANGTRVQSRFFTCVLLPNGRSLPRLGLVVSRKFGDSVERNRAKRLIREMFRQQLPTAMGFGADLVIIPRRELLGVPFRTVSEDFGRLWQRAAARVIPPARV